MAGTFGTVHVQWSGIQRRANGPTGMPRGGEECVLGGPKRGSSARFVRRDSPRRFVGLLVVGFGWSQFPDFRATRTSTGPSKNSETREVPYKRNMNE